VSRRWLLVLPLLVAAASCSSDAPAGPSAAVTTPPTSERTTTMLSVEQEVEAAYLRSWDVYAKAVRDLDPSGLEESYADAALDLERNEVARLKAANTPIVVEVDHDLAVEIVRDGEALVFDTYVNRNYRIDSSGKPIDDPNKAGTYSETYQMRRIGGRWLVVRVVRQS
jgi:hypothetical protein